MFMIFVGCSLTSFGIYDKLGEFAGAGSIVPVTGFANSVTSPAIEYKKRRHDNGHMRKDVHHCRTCNCYGYSYIGYRRTAMFSGNRRLI